MARDLISFLRACRSHRWLVWCCIVGLVAVGCSARDVPRSAATTLDLSATPEPAPTVSAAPTLVPDAPPPTQTPAPASTSLPTATPTALPAPTSTALPTPTPTPEPGWRDGACVAPALATPDPNRPVYRASVDIDPTRQRVSGDMTIAFQPDLAVDEVVLRLWANNPREASFGVSIGLFDVVVDGVTLTQDRMVRPNATTVRLLLDDTAAPGDVINISLTFELRTRGPGKARIADGAGWMRLGTFLPLLAWEPGVGWATEPGTSQFAEAVVSTTADYQVTTTVPDGFDVLATGRATDNADGSITWTGTAVRDFAASVGQFRFADRVVDLGTGAAATPVALRVGMHTSIDEDVAFYADRIEASLVDMSRRYGTYPWDTLTVGITPGIGGGIEFPTHIMLGNGTSGRTTPHEVGHMFFYSLVGNNQGRDPWMDEGLASWAEFVHEGVNMQDLVLDEVSATSGQPMTFFAGRSDYYDAVYRRPAVALSRLGSIEEVDCALKIFVAENAYAIARPDDLISAFEMVFGDVSAEFAALGISR